MPSALFPTATYYAPGGGLGHLTRARAFLHTTGIAATIVTSSPYADIAGFRDVIIVPPHLDKDREACSHFLEKTFSRFDRVFLDSFPFGIFGELGSSQRDFEYVARAVKWETYLAAIGEMPARRFARTWIVEELPDDQLEFVDSASAEVERIELRDPPVESRFEGVPRPYWLVVHSGPAEEVTELVSYADEQRRIERSAVTLLILTRSEIELPPGSQLVDLYPASSLMPSAERIFTAGGFNSVREARPFRDKHTIFPFPRRYDDQFRRAAMARRLP